MPLYHSTTKGKVNSQWARRRMISLFISKVGEDLKPAQVARVCNLHLAYYTCSLCAWVCACLEGVRCP